MAECLPKDGHIRTGSQKHRKAELVNLSSVFGSTPSSSLLPLCSPSTQDVLSAGPRYSTTQNRISRSNEREDDENSEQLSNKGKQIAPTSSRSSSTSSNIQIPLLPRTLEQQGQQFSSLPNYRTHTKSRNTWLSPFLLFKAVRLYCKNAFSGKSSHAIEGGRHVKVDINRTKPLVDERTGKPYIGNRIRSNKYTLWTFIPRQLVAQFSKLANFYFLCFAVMQLIPGLSTTGNYTNIIPLMVFVSISMAKEGYDDYRRHRLDNIENKRETLVLDTVVPLSAGVLNWRRTEWRDLRVGDIIKLKRDELIPADIVLLRSTSPRESNMTYVETTALDGETNLKRKQAVKNVAEACSSSEDLTACSIEFVTEHPNPNLDIFKGRVVVSDQTLSLSNTNIIYRGSVLRNTSEITAMILYTGEDCKIRLNASGNRSTRIKAPRLQFMLNRIVILVVCLVVGLSIYNTLAYQGWRSEVEIKLFYLSSAAVPFHEEVFGFIIMFGTMVPLSLYVSMEMIKLAQIFFLNADVEMYDERSNTPFEARTSTINEELGQVTHIFSDKTGTLTDNEMKFRKLYVAGTEWTHESNNVPSQDMVRGASRSQSRVSTKLSKTKPVAERTTNELVMYLSQRPTSAFAHSAKLMLLCIALCHNCIPEKTPNGTAIDFQASSPDELALVRAAQEMGFLMRNRDLDTITLALSSPYDATIETETYEVLNVIEFSNLRKRMSVVVRFPDGRICVICKGADSVIVERLKLSGVGTRKAAESQGRDERVEQENNTSLHLPLIGQPVGFVESRCSGGNNDQAFSILDEIPTGDGRLDIERCMRSVNSFAGESLRTLLYAYRFLEDEEYVEWRKIWDAATTSLSNQENMVESAGELIEVNFELAGATAIEDKLQQGVSESIDKLCRANIKIWMLTGDKLETAINIGHSCGLIRSDSVVFNLEESHDIRELMSSGISILKTAVHSVVVIDGRTLTAIYEEPCGPLEAIFFDLVVLADSVICCRAQPSQKAQLVSGIRNRVPNSVTLAIGDGANDIAMIQEAHIGIGITGKEGLQAARSSDYSIAQFRFLQKLLLVHGRWNYIRTSKYILGTLWKEVVFFLPQALFQRCNGFTGTSLYEPWSLTTYNTLFTSLPVLVIGIFEKDLTASTLLAVPELYKTMGQRNRGFNIWIYLAWTAMAVAESMIVYFCMLTLFATAETTRDSTLFSMGDLDFVAVVIVISMKLQIIEMHNKSIIAMLSVFLSVGAAFLWNIVLAGAYPLMTPYEVRGAFFHGFGQNPKWWMTLISIVVSVYILELSVSAFRKALFPTDTDVFQELEHERAHKMRPEEVGAPGWRETRNRYDEQPLTGIDGLEIPLQDLSKVA